MRYYLLLSLIIMAMALSPQPVPTCSKPDITVRNLPISPFEVQSFNMNDIFKGYNLNYKLVGQPDFVQLRNKFELYKTQNISQPGLKSFHMDHENNHWGNKLVTTSDVKNSTVVRWGSSQNSGAIPTVNMSAIVESDTKITCFDAVWLRTADIIMVDCVKQANYALQNIFFYVNATSQLVIEKQVNNDMWVGFTSITRRKIVHYTEDGEQYLIRAYFADGVNRQQWHNTFVQILLINNPYKPWAIKVMDRSYLHQDMLSITDFKVYLGDIYILDYHKGVVSFDITPSQNIVIKGRYRTDSGYLSMGVYSNNLANEVLLALANEHGIYEIDWTDQIKPTVIAKYSLMEGSRVWAMWVNEEYIACQVRANVTNGKNQTEEYHSTIIFDRGTRTYTNAYAVIHHPSYRAGVDLDIQHNALLSIDEDSIDTYFLDEPLMFVSPSDHDSIGKQYNFTVTATSVNENTNESLICSFDWKFTVVDIDSKYLWQTDIPVPSTYYANYPGELVIPLNRYVMGANLTFGVQQKLLNESTGQLPTYWVYQQNDTIIHWDTQPSFYKYTFLRKEQFEFMGDQYFFVYTQDAANNFYLAECKAAPFSKDVHCKENSKLLFINHKINNLTATAFQPNYGDHLHLLAITFDTFPNQVFIYDVHKRDLFARPIMMEKDWQGKIQSIEFLGHYLVVVLRHVKTIVFYDMKACHDHQDNQCQQIYRIDSLMMDKLGVPYFSPLQVYTSDFHPFVLFIHNTDSVIILDITPQGPILLNQIQSPASKDPGFWKWKMAITKGNLVIINPPFTIQEYNLQELYTRKVTHRTKFYSLYNYTIPDKFDCDFSDEGDLLYITAVDKNLPAEKNSVILVYRSSTPAVAALYDVFHIEGKYEDMLLDVTGTYADYVSVTMGSILMMFRQYSTPLLVFEDNWNNFQFNITYTNDAEHSYFYSSNSEVIVANYPEKIVVNNSMLNQNDYLTNEVNYDYNTRKQVRLDDSTWFNGTVLNYTIENCNDCGDKVRVVNHLEDKRDFFAEADMEDYVYSRSGGYVQQFQSILKMQHNGSIDQITVFPSVLDGEHCTHIQHSWIYDYTLSACQHLGEIYLYTTTFSSFKPFVNGPFYSGAKYVSGLHIMEDILVLVDVDEDPQHRTRAGGVMIFAMNHDPFDPEMFDLVEIIETDDLEHAVNWPGGEAFIGSAQLVFTNDSSIYRLAITETKHGLFFVDFRFTRGRQSLEIVKVQFIDLNKAMAVDNLHMPNLAFFWGLAITNEYYDSIYKYWQLEIVVTTTRFHTLQFNFHIDRTGSVLEVKLAKIYYRYGYYDVAGYIKHFDGYFAIIHNLPSSLDTFTEMSKKVLSVYDTRERWVFNQQTQQQVKVPENYFQGTTVPAMWMLGGMRFRKGRLAYDFNFTMTRNRTDPFRNIGLLVVHDRQAIIREVAIHDQIRIIVEQNLQETQQAFLSANSDFNSVAIPLKLIGKNSGGLSGVAIVAIVIGSLLVVVGGAYLAYKWNLGKKKQEGKGMEESLLDRDTLNVPKDDDDNDENNHDESDQQDEEDQQDDDEQDAEQGDKNQEQTQQPQPVVAESQSIRYPSIASQPEKVDTTGPEVKEQDGKDQKVKDGPSGQESA